MSFLSLHSWKGGSALISPVCIFLLWRAFNQSIQALTGLPKEDVEDVAQVHLTRGPSKGQIVVHVLSELLPRSH